MAFARTPSQQSAVEMPAVDDAVVAAGAVGHDTAQGRASGGTEAAPSEIMGLKELETIIIIESGAGGAEVL